jgi:alpha/beta superfamily hydrolase
VSTRRVEFASGLLTLEGELHLPDGAGPNAAVIVCHPHPLYGGNMHNNVVGVVCQALVDRGIAALAFNFRGVGRSQGTHDNGFGEREDVRSALKYASSLDGVEAVGLAGYSFGAGVSARAVDDSVAALCLVALPTGRTLSEDAGLRRYSRPVLMLAGDVDTVCELPALEELAATLPAPVEVRGVPGADHGWWGHEEALAEAAGDFFAPLLLGPAVSSA